MSEVSDGHGPLDGSTAENNGSGEQIQTGPSAAATTRQNSGFIFDRSSGGYLTIVGS